ncbi:MAG: alpha/beta hydrolase [Granulosicoccus sp.]|nr:alpha/beta hydrolase [Granulosicoccus sp.]
MPTVQVNQAEMAYSVNGAPARDDDLSVVLVHGAGGRDQDWPQAWRSVDDVTRAMGLTPASHVGDLDQYPVYSLDLPGHGQSGGSGCTTVDAYADAIEGFMDALDLKRVVLTGHSMGAAITLLVAVRQNPRLAAAVLIGSAAKLQVSPDILDGLQNDFENTVDAIIKFSWYKETGAFFKEKGRQRMLETGSEVVHGDYFACADFDLNDQLDKVQVPSLLIASDKDRMVRMDQSEATAKTLGSTFVGLKECGHFQHIEQTAKCAEALSGFLKSLV